MSGSAYEVVHPFTWERERELPSLGPTGEPWNNPPPHPLSQRQIELQEAMAIARGYGNCKRLWQLQEAMAIQLEGQNANTLHPLK